MSPLPLLLAIDDTPERYEDLTPLLAGRARLVIAGCSRCIRHHLPEAAAVFLDYDLDTERECATCARPIEQVKSTCYIDHVIFRDIPVLVVSESEEANVRHLCAILEVNRTTHARLGGIGLERAWIEHLQSWGVLTTETLGERGTERA